MLFTDLVAGDLEFLRDELVDPQVGLVEEKEIDVFELYARGIQGLE